MFIEQVGKAVKELLTNGWFRLVRRLAPPAVFLALAAAPLPGMQAAVEYAAKSGQSAVSTVAGERARLGVCPVDSHVVTCVSLAYPKTSVAVTVIALLGLMRLASRSGRRVAR